MALKYNTNIYQFIYLAHITTSTTIKHELKFSYLFSLQIAFPKTFENNEK